MTMIITIKPERLLTLIEYLETVHVAFSTSDRLIIQEAIKALQKDGALTHEQYYGLMQTINARKKTFHNQEANAKSNENKLFKSHFNEAYSEQIRLLNRLWIQFSMMHYINQRIMKAEKDRGKANKKSRQILR